MKKFFKTFLAFAFSATVGFSFSACANDKKEDLPDLKVYAPDGAPALALVNAIAQEKTKEEDSFDFEIVNADKIASYVTGAELKADFCILPSNVAAKLLGDGTVYQMLGTVTNGNLFFLATGEREVLNRENLKEALIGKKIGTVQLVNVPGLTLQAVLADYEIPYQSIQSADANVDADKVNLIPFTPDDVTPAGKCDYYLCPEPAASAKIKGTSSTKNPFKLAGNLQELYGESEGYPQAVAVAKKSVIENRLEEVKIFLEYLEKSAAYLDSVDINKVADLIRGEVEDGATSTWNEKNLTKEVIANCSVKFTASRDCKDQVKTFLEKLQTVKADSTKIPEDEFFYLG